MSSAGRCMARNTSSGTLVGPGIARNSRPARTTISLFLVLRSPDERSDIRERKSARERSRGRCARPGYVRSAFYAGGGQEESGYLLVSRQPAASASSTEQNQRVPLATFIWIFAYQRLVGL